MMEIPWQKLEARTLNLLLQEIVTRDGTDYGAVESSLEQRLDQAMKGLQQGRAALVWNEETESANLVERSSLSD